MQESVLGQHRCPESLKQDVLVAAAIANAGAARAIGGAVALSGEVKNLQELSEMSAVLLCRWNEEKRFYL